MSMTTGTNRMANPLASEWEKYVHNIQRPGLGAEACVKEYDNEDAVKGYADMSIRISYRGPRYCADMLSVVVEPADRSKVLVLDIGAGTGMVGEQLYKRGFRNIHAHDGAMKMVEACKKTGFYKDFFCFFLSEDSPIPLPSDTYDIIACSGGVCENHFPTSIQAQIIRILKPGGYFVNAFRSNMLTNDYGKAWDEEASRLVKEKKWDKYGRLIFPRYNMFSEGLLDLYQKL